MAVSRSAAVVVTSVSGPRIMAGKQRAVGHFFHDTQHRAPNGRDRADTSGASKGSNEALMAAKHWVGQIKDPYKGRDEVQILV
jgi:hypothetical protein